MTTRPRRVRRTHIGAALVAAGALLVAACAPPPAPEIPPLVDGGIDPDLAPLADVAAYAGIGPFEVGVATVTLEAGRQMEVWYPADPADVAGATPESYRLRDFISPTLSSFLSPDIDPVFDTPAFRDVAALAGAERPMVLFSHGASGFRLQSTVLTTHLASWGFVVLSPDYFERGLQSLLGGWLAPPRTNEQITQLAVDAAIDLDDSGPLAGLIDTTRLFPIGHSAGGSQSTQLAGSRTDVQSWIPLASGINLTPSLFNPAPTVPAGVADPDKTVMWVAGENDGVARLAGIRDGYTYSAGEKKLVVIPGAGHNNAFTDFCEIGREDGGIIGLAQSGGLVLPDFIINLANDGCFSPPNFVSDDVWPVANHFVTAELRYRSGLDTEPVGLGAGVVDEFGPVVPEYHHNE